MDRGNTQNFGMDLAELRDACGWGSRRM